MWRKNKTQLGGNLVEYIIPLATFGIVFGISLYSIYQSGTLNNFIAASTGGTLKNGTLSISSLGSTVGNSSTTTNSATTNTATTNTATNTSTEETSSLPGCSAGICVVTVGGYTLTGIPEDMAQAIEADGTGGVENQVGLLLKQLADQVIAETGDPEDELAFWINRLAGSVGDIQYKSSSESSLIKDKDSFSNLIYDYEYAIQGKNTPDGKYIVDGSKVCSDPTLGCDDFYPAGTLADSVTHQLVYDPSEDVQSIINGVLKTGASNPIVFDEYFMPLIADRKAKATGAELDRLIKLEAAVSELNNLANTLRTNFIAAAATNSSDIDAVNKNVASKTEDLYGVLMCVSDKINCK